MILLIILQNRQSIDFFKYKLFSIYYYSQKTKKDTIDFDGNNLNHHWVNVNMIDFINLRG